MQNIDSDLIRGNIDTIILKTMLNEDKYGLDIIKEVSDKSSGTYELKQPTLYSCLKRLENQGLLSSYFVDSEIGGKRHYYKLTDKGRDFYNKKQEEWAKSKFIIDNLLSNYNYEEYRLIKKDEYDQMLQNKSNIAHSPADSTIIDEPLQNTENESELVEETEPENLTTTNIENSEESDNLDNLIVEDFSENIEVNDNIDEDISEANFETKDNDTNSVDNQDYSSDIEQTAKKLNEDFPLYVDGNTNENVDFDDEITNSNVSYETTDQTSNELNFLSKLHAQEDEEINTYVGDQKSYINHLNSLDDSQLEQQNLLDDSLFVNPNSVDESINSFSNAINNLKNINNQNNFDDETDDEEIEDKIDEPTEYNYISRAAQNNSMEYDDDLSELNELKQNQNNNFFNSFDNAEYNHGNQTENYDVSSQNEYDASLTDSSDASFEDEYDNESFNNSFENISNEINPNDNNNEQNVYDEHQDNLNAIDSIISNNISLSYQNVTPRFKEQNTCNYRDKLSNLSMYSKVSLKDENKPEIQNASAIEKAKNISEITKELEEEGIKIKEHYKSSAGKSAEKNYLLANKINLMKSLIMFFGYVFILSAVYIVLNNTSLKDQSWFNIKYFLYGFIPFAIILLFQIIIYAVNPYKKIAAKLHARIMFFISIIISIQLLLITYCVNLQMGFYSFSQLQYNHLFWIIPTIISFAPIIDNLVYMALFKSKNFNV